MVKPGVSHWYLTSHDINELSEFKDEELLQGEHAALDGTVWKKIDRWVIPLCTSFFLLAAVDRTNIANVRVAGLQTSLAMSNYQFTLALTVAPFIAAQFPATLLLKHVGPNLMLPSMVALWGVISASQGLVSNYPGFLACRFFLGLVQGGLPPSVILYLSCFYPWKGLQMQIAAFNATASLASAFSGLLAAAIDQLDGKGGQPGWAWILILEGIFTFVFEEEREYVVFALKHAGSISEDEVKDSFSWREVFRVAKSLHVWLLLVISFLNGTILFGLAYFEPTIVAGLGYSGNQAQLMSVPPFAATFVLSIVSAIVSDRYQCRGYTVIFFSLVQAIGFAMFYASTSNHIRYASLFFSATGSFCVYLALATWIANNSAPHTRRATTVAVNSIVAELGGLLATWLIGSLSSAPNYTSATITFIIMSVGMAIFASANLAYLWWQNRLKGEERQRVSREEEPDSLGDRSAWFIYNL